MTTINITRNEIEAAFKELRSKAEQLEIAPANISFATSDLEIAKKMEEVEEAYYQAISQYKTILLQCEQSIFAKIEEFIKTEEDISRNMK
ncbi:MAG: DUF5344 family protein [Bacillus sp. (in: firmicutes)]